MNGILLFGETRTVDCDDADDAVLMTAVDVRNGMKKPHKACYVMQYLYDHITNLKNVRYEKYYCPVSGGAHQSAVCGDYSVSGDLISNAERERRG